MLFLDKKQDAFGLDISDASVKLTQLERVKGKIQIKALGQIPVPKGLILNEKILDSKTFGFLIKKLLEKPQAGRVSTRLAVVNLPEPKAFVRVIQIPRMSAVEAENAVPFEAENFIPMPVDQVYLDWQKLDEEGDKMNILLIASPKEFVENYLRVMDEAGIIPMALEVESQSCLRSLLPQGSGETALICDLDMFRTSLVMVEKGELQFTSTIPIAGNTFTESIANYLGVSSVKAEEIKKRVGVDNVPEYPNIKTALLPVLNNLSAEIKNILKFHGEHSKQQVSRILLAGGGAETKNLAEYLATQFSEYPEIKIELGNPAQNLDPNAGPDLKKEILDYTTSIGLALRGINF